MTFATMTNIATMILCIAVLIQTVRLMAMLATVKGGALTDMVKALDVATNEARQVMAGLSALLQTDVAQTSRTLIEGKTMVEELTIMTGIANAIAERIVDAASASNGLAGYAAPDADLLREPPPEPSPRSHHARAPGVA
jgi:hypothetical protein